MLLASSSFNKQNARPLTIRLFGVKRDPPVSQLFPVYPVAHAHTCESCSKSGWQRACSGHAQDIELLGRNSIVQNNKQISIEIKVGHVN